MISNNNAGKKSGKEQSPFELENYGQIFWALSFSRTKKNILKMSWELKVPFKK